MDLACSQPVSMHSESVNRVLRIQPLPLALQETLPLEGGEVTAGANLTSEDQTSAFSTSLDEIINNY